MENNQDMVLSGQKVGKEYQIPELVDLKGIGEAMATCGTGSTPSITGCTLGSGNDY